MRREQPQRVLVTGAGGFLGSHLCPLLAEQYDVTGVDLPGVAPSFDGDWRVASAADDAAKMISEQAPHTVVHAAFHNRAPHDTSRTEYLDGVLSQNLPLFEACSKQGVELILCSSSAVYAPSSDGRRLTEAATVAPVSLYGVAKAFQEMIADVFRVDGLQICTVRLFNLVGPGQSQGMLVPDWLHGVAAISRGGDPVLWVRNRRTARDFVDVRDAARALCAMVSDYRPGEVVNVASGEAVSLMELSRFLETLCPVPFEIVETTPAIDDADVPVQRGDASRARELWGWTPSIDWRQSVTDAWRELQETMEPAGPA